MSVKKNPQSLYLISLQHVSKILLQCWKNTHSNDNTKQNYSQEFKLKVGVLIPYTIYEHIFEQMVDFHARTIQNDPTNDNIPRVPSLINSIITPHLSTLKLSCLRHMGIVMDEEINYLESLLMYELPNLNNLVEISLVTSGIHSTLPTCNDDILKKISCSCQKLKSLDVSFNHTVTDIGLEYLVSLETSKGCPLLVKVGLFGCSVTNIGVCKLIDRLSYLKFLNYRETGQSIKLLGNTRPWFQTSNELELVHLNNLGTDNRTCKNVYKLQCNEEMVDILLTHCPKLSGLKVRIHDSEVIHLQKLNNVRILELLYNLGVPSSPGNTTVQYLQLCGTQLTSLSFVCDMFGISLLKTVCEQCINLSNLSIRSNNFKRDSDITKSDKKKCSLSNLEKFCLRVGTPGFEECQIPQSVLIYILHKSYVLREIDLVMKDSLFCDSYVHELFGSIQTQQLKRIMLLVPPGDITVSALNLTMVSVETLIFSCPQLELLGNITVWDISMEEVVELRRQLQRSNSALVLFQRIMYS